MSSQLFPVLQSSNWKLTRSARWKTQVQVASSGNRKRNPLQKHTLWKWTLKNGVLQAAPAIGDLQAIQDLFVAMYGRLDFFLWSDPEPASIADPTYQINVLGTYYWPVAFLADAVDFDRFAYQLWTCGTLEFEQVGLSTLALAKLQQPHGAITAATLHVTWSYDAGGGGLGPGPTIVTGAFPPVFSGSWATRTDSLVVTVTPGFGLSGWSGFIGFSTPDNGTVSPAWLLSVYEITATATYQDGTTDTLHPSVVAEQGNDPDYGTVLNPGNAADNNLATAATMTGTQVFFGRSNGRLVFTFF